MRQMKYLVIFSLSLLILFKVPIVSAEEIFTTEKLITVDTAKQMLYVWDNGELINQSPVSTGLIQTPTVKGSFNIYYKLPKRRMRGYSIVRGWYDLPNVPDVMYFYKWDINTTITHPYTKIIMPVNPMDGITLAFCFLDL